MRNVLSFKKPLMGLLVSAVAIVMFMSAGCAANRLNKTKADIPVITAMDTIDGAQAKALLFSCWWSDGKENAAADAIPTWQGGYTKENTLVLDGEMGQNMITLSAEKPMTASYVIYLPDGTVYDNGTREVYDSLSPRLYWADNKAGIGIIAPFEPGEYIYEVTIGWEKDSLKATYGIKVVMTGDRSAYDEALSVIHNYNKAVLSVSLKRVETIPDVEYAGDCYIFEVGLPDSTVQAAVSKAYGSLFIYDEGHWSKASREIIVVR